MSEIKRIADLLEQTFEGSPYFGPSVLDTLKNVTGKVAAHKPRWSVHSMWEIVAHLTAELNYAREVLNGTAGPWIEGETTWPPITDTSEAAWREAVRGLKKANRALVRAVKQLDDSVLDRKPARVRGSFYTMLHGTLHHTIHHAGQLSLLSGSKSLSRTKNSK